jgi:hypothetical protein
MLHVGLENRGLQMVALDCRFVVHDEAVRVTDKLNKLLRIPYSLVVLAFILSTLYNHVGRSCRTWTKEHSFTIETTPFSTVPNRFASSLRRFT